MHIESVSKSFGQGRVLRNISLKIGGRDIVGITGPGGSGKTVALGLVAGHIKPSAGRILLGGRDLAELPAEARLACGIAQGDEIAPGFFDLTVLQTVLIGAGARPSPLYARQGGATERDAGLGVLARTGLEAVADRTVAALDAVQRRMLTIAVALASRPSLLLLDEPLRGLAPADCSKLAALIGDIRDSGVSILLAARHMPMMLAVICDRVVALRSGEIVAEDMLSRIRRNPAELAAS